jgi:hypothetical protein
VRALSDLRHGHEGEEGRSNPIRLTYRHSRIIAGRIRRGVLWRLSHPVMSGLLMLLLKDALLSIGVSGRVHCSGVFGEGMPFGCVVDMRWCRDNVVVSWPQG